MRCLPPVFLLFLALPAPVFAEDTLQGFVAIEEIVPVSYAYDPTGYAAYTATGAYGDPGPGDDGLPPNIPTKLIDGNVPTDFITSGSWVGVRVFTGGNKAPNLTFDLGPGLGYSLERIDVTYSPEGGGVTEPEQVDFYTSLDGVTFDFAGSGTGFSSAGPETLQFPVSIDAARFVQLDFTNGSGWTFLGEVDFFGTAILPLTPEPSSWGLFALALVGLAGYYGHRRTRSA